jgi:hypothetical protein
MQTPDLFPSHVNLHRRQHNSLNGFSNFVTHIGYRSTVAASLSVAAISAAAAGLGTENKSLPRIARPIK